MQPDKNAIYGLFEAAMQAIAKEIQQEPGSNSFTSLPIEQKKLISRQIITNLAAEVLFPFVEMVRDAAIQTFNHHVRVEVSDTGFLFQYIIPTQDFPEMCFGIYITLSDHYNIFNVYEDWGDKPRIVETIRTQELNDETLSHFLHNFIKKVLHEIMVLKPPIDSLSAIKKIGEKGKDFE
jgi:hypothetical protein